MNVENGWRGIRLSMHQGAAKLERLSHSQRKEQPVNYKLTSNQIKSFDLLQNYGHKPPGDSDPRKCNALPAS